MFETFGTFEYAAIISSGVFTFFLLSKLVEIIPFRMMIDWQREYKEGRHMLNQEINPLTYKVSSFFKLSLVIISMVIVTSISFIKGTDILEFIVFTLFFLVLVLLVGINLKHQIYPDIIVFPMIWGGLVYNTYVGNEAPEYIYGAIIGYLLPYSAYWAFKLTTGKAVIGYGDFKLLSMMGAWFGITFLPSVLLISISTWFVQVSILTLIMIKDSSKQAPLGTAMGYLVAAYVVYLHGRII